MKKIAVLINCRVEGNPNCGLLNLLESLSRNTEDRNALEVLVKFDSCDKEAAGIIGALDTYPLTIRWIVEPRGRGYIDIHTGYNRLLLHMSPDVELIGAMADDFIVEPGWDTALMNIYAPNGTEFDRMMILHQRPHPPTERVNYQTEPFYLEYDVLHSMEDLFIVDESPFWSRKLIFATTWLGGGLSFTDGWTLALEHALWNNHRIDITRFTDRLYINRMVHPVQDTQRNAERWNGDRRINFEFVRSAYFKEIVTNQAQNIALRMQCQTKTGTGNVTSAAGRQTIQPVA